MQQNIQRTPALTTAAPAASAIGALGIELTKIASVIGSMMASNILR